MADVHTKEIAAIPITIGMSRIKGGKTKPVRKTPLEKCRLEDFMQLAIEENEKQYH